MSTKKEEKDPVYPERTVSPTASAQSESRTIAHGPATVHSESRSTTTSTGRAKVATGTGSKTATYTEAKTIDCSSPDTYLCGCQAVPASELSRYRKFFGNPLSCTPLCKQQTCYQTCEKSACAKPMGSQGELCAGIVDQAMVDFVRSASCLYDSGMRMYECVKGTSITYADEQTYEAITEGYCIPICNLDTRSIECTYEGRFRDSYIYDSDLPRAPFTVITGTDFHHWGLPAANKDEFTGVKSKRSLHFADSRTSTTASDGESVSVMSEVFSNAVNTSPMQCLWSDDYLCGCQVVPASTYAGFADFFKQPVSCTEMCNEESCNQLCEQSICVYPMGSLGEWCGGIIDQAMVDFVRESSCTYDYGMTMYRCVRGNSVTYPDEQTYTAITAGYCVPACQLNYGLIECTFMGRFRRTSIYESDLPSAPFTVITGLDFLHWEAQTTTTTVTTVTEERGKIHGKEEAERTETEVTEPKEEKPSTVEITEPEHKHMFTIPAWEHHHPTKEKNATAEEEKKPVTTAKETEKTITTEPTEEEKKELEPKEVKPEEEKPSEVKVTPAVETTTKKTTKESTEEQQPETAKTKPLKETQTKPEEAEKEKEKETEAETKETPDKISPTSVTTETKAKVGVGEEKEKEKESEEEFKLEPLSVEEEEEPGSEETPGEEEPATEETPGGEEPAGTGEESEETRATTRTRTRARTETTTTTETTGTAETEAGSEEAATETTRATTERASEQTTVTETTTAAGEEPAEEETTEEPIIEEVPTGPPNDNSLYFGPFGECSQVCSEAGSSYKERSIICRDHAGIPVSLDKCDLPEDFNEEFYEECNPVKCGPGNYVQLTDWSTCGKECAAVMFDGSKLPNRSTRQYECRRAGGGRVVAKENCADLVAELGIRLRKNCNTVPCTRYAYRLGPWKECDCKKWTQTRAITCVRLPENRKVPESMCNAFKLEAPPSERQCFPQKCFEAVGSDGKAETDYCQFSKCSQKGDCKDGKCDCNWGSDGADCQMDIRSQPRCERPSLWNKDGQCCLSGVFDSKGECCEGANNEVDCDIDGKCCMQPLDGCGFCSEGTPKFTDSTGQCCEVLDASGTCCNSGHVDECGVCDGSGSSCRSKIDFDVRIARGQDLEGCGNELGGVISEAFNLTKLTWVKQVKGKRTISFAKKDVALTSGFIWHKVNSVLKDKNMDAFCNVQGVKTSRVPICGNGICEIGEPFNCVKDCGYGIKLCQKQRGRFNEPVMCNGHGICSIKTAKCVCFDGYEGKNCEKCGSGFFSVGDDGRCIATEAYTSRPARN